jgi:predicted Zn-dependent peptidase
MINYFSNEVQYNFIDYPIIKNDALYPTDNIEMLNEFKEKSSIIFQSPIITKDFIYVMFIKYMLSMGLQSPLYDEVREKLGLVYYVSMYPMVLGYDKVQMNLLEC